MKKILLGLMCLIITLSFASLSMAEGSDASILEYDELMRWVNSYLDLAKSQEPLNAPIGEEALTEDGYAYIYNFGTLYFDKPTQEGASLNALVVSDLEQAAPRTASLSASLNDLLAAYYNENPDLVGDEDFAVLYCIDTLPSSAAWAWVQRTGQQVGVVQYAVHEQPASGENDGYTDCGLVYTLQENTVVSVKAYGLNSMISQEQVQSNLAAVKQVQQMNSYHMYPTSALGTDLEAFDRDDLTFSGIDFLSVTPEEAISLWGEVVDDVWMEDGANYLRTVSFPNAILTFAYNSDKTFSHLDFLTIDGPNLEGPRGVRIDESLSSVIMRFRHSEGAFDGVKEILYGDGVTAPYGTAEYGDNASATLRYAIDLGDGRHVTLHMNFTLNTLSEIMVYCW
ncbi:MAG: hypothetical protein IJ461_06870 [Clostridia bacterium]|nr:hypothetical protein [Clostridia bacterium]